MKMHSLASIILAAALAIGTLSSCSSVPSGGSSAASSSLSTSDTPAASQASTGEASTVPVSDSNTLYPVLENPITLDIMVTRSDNQPAWNDIYVWQKYEEMTNVHVNWIEVSSSERSEKISTSLASGNLPDVFFRCKISASDQLLYGDQGLFLDLTANNMLQDYAPNYWNYLQKYKDTMASVQNPDGSIYSFPQVNDGAELRVSRKLFVNTNWLKNLGKELPKTTDDLYDLLVAFKEQDANGNGDISDEIPFCTQDWAGFQDIFLGAFGLSNRGQQNQLVDWDEENNTVRLIAATDGYKQMLQYMNKLYMEGLVDQELFTMTKANWVTKAEDDKIGMFAFTNLSSVPSGKVDNWVGIDEALEGPNDDKLWAPVRAHFHSTGAAVISSTNKYPQETLQWLDYFWTDEGNLFYHYGVEGETFVALDDGTYDWNEKVRGEMTGSRSFDEVVSSYTPYTGGNNPLVEEAPYFSGGETEPVPAASARALFEYATDTYWPSFTFTFDENEELIAIQTDIKKLIDTARTEFITGTKSFDEWDSYVDSLNKMGLEKMLTIYAAAVERFDAIR
ncbi:extracellular solute-binding protein [Ruminococcaceae bacterium OttesenSCG-928-L11]|nr:extracellular solute-binding protein [Ruminococcaceae bacterium OttesenSCG-928-L11]